MDVATCSLADLDPERWKNGAGWTRELLILPEDASLARAEFTTRVSIATIEADAAFSTLPGYDRFFLPVSGGGFELVHDDEGAHVPQRTGQLYRFDGEWATRAAGVRGPIQVLNVMTQRGSARATLEVLRSLGRARRFAIETPHAVFLLFQGEASVRVSGEDEPLELEPGSAVWMQGAERGDELVVDELADDSLAVYVELL